MRTPRLLNTAAARGTLYAGRRVESAASRVFRIIAALAVIAALTFLFYKLLAVNSTTVALVFVLAILAIATGWGLTEAILASVLAMLCFNFFFLPPVGTLTIADPQNWFALLTFLITAIVGSQLSASVRKREREATARRDEVEKLYELSRAVMLTAHVHDIERLSEDASVFSPPKVLRSTIGRPARFIAPDRAPCRFPTRV